MQWISRCSSTRSVETQQWTQRGRHHDQGDGGAQGQDSADGEDVKVYSEYFYVKTIITGQCINVIIRWWSDCTANWRDKWTKVYNCNLVSHKMYIVRVYVNETKSC